MATRKAAAPKIVQVCKEGDLVDVTIRGYVTEADATFNGNFSYGIEFASDPGNDFYWGSGNTDITVNVVEAAVNIEDGSVIKDAEGCIFQRMDGEWRGIRYNSCDTPTRPWKLLVEAE